MCLCVSLFVLYRNPNGWTDRDKIWHGGGPQGVEGSWGGGFDPVPHPPDTGCVKGCEVPLEPQPCVLVKTL